MLSLCNALQKCAAQQISLQCHDTVGVCLHNHRVFRCLIALRKLRLNPAKGKSRRSWSEEGDKRFVEINVCRVTRSTTYHGKESVVDKKFPVDLHVDLAFQICTKQITGAR